MSNQVIREDRLPETLRYIGGVDVAYVDKWATAAAVVLNYVNLSLVETQKARVRIDFPYIPTLLSFREIKPAQAAIRKLKLQPDVFLIDAQGIAHPYRLGFASHLGLILDKPTIGVAKNLLIGQVESANGRSWSPITDKGEVIGAAVKTNVTGQPVYVSIGHKASLETAIEIIQHCTRSGRIPEPTRIAHSVASEEKKKYKQKIMH